MGRAFATTAILLVTVLLAIPARVDGQQPAASNGQPSGQPAGQQAAAGQPSGLDDTLAAGDDELYDPVRKLVKFNEINRKSWSFRVGAGFLEDYAAYSQDQASEEQFSLFPQTKVRDSRVLFKGSFKEDRSITWSCGILYDTAIKKGLFRETGVMFAIPQISGYIFVGRTKEGFSLNKIMVGYAGWTMERATANDALIPLLADGIKWIGYAPKKHLIWNIGAFADPLSEGESFSTYSKQVVGRIVWLPIETNETVLDLGFNLRYGTPDDRQLRNKSRPEVFEAPFFIDTGLFPAKSATTADFEAYYRPGPLLVGTEYFIQKADAPESRNPFFQGVDSVVAWVFTGEERPYNTRSGFFEQVSPARPVFQGGPGAFELVARFSYTDLDSGPIQGGKFWRFTPMVNWYLSDNVRLEFTYGFGSLNRFGLVGMTQFFQSRLQLVL